MHILQAVLPKRMEKLESNKYFYEEILFSFLVLYPTSELARSRPEEICNRIKINFEQIRFQFRFKKIGVDLRCLD